MTTKLSTLIRRGAQIRPQACGSFVYTVWPLKNGIPTPETCTCALGAAYEALTGELPDPFASFDSITTFLQDSTDSQWTEIPYPDETSLAKDTDQTTDVVVSLNDYYHWTREQIADYLEQQGQ
jgi:hypothetical protein